jgi:hypothetical protein
MRELRDVPPKWKLDAPTLMFERNGADGVGVFICSSCRKPIASSDFYQAFTLFYSHRCKKTRKMKARAGK